MCMEKAKSTRVLDTSNQSQRRNAESIPGDRNSQSALILSLANRQITSLP